MQELDGMTRTLVHDSVNKCEGASSHSASPKLACLLGLDRVGRNTLPIPELSQNPVRHVQLDTFKICNKLVPRGNPASLNLLSLVRYPPNLISCHHIQSQANIQ
ncbi:hypothetical protein M9H77_12469 [Catharanthus roseus]|uniref:Uncharacterized protein n=1 Tax=Catharanthus roseus TaxID=4058 RepID=A0ACC0BHJ4_CATRO|nr:hypothetical protein M9H77_12469 [Catharanthus roseus]